MERGSEMGSKAHRILRSGWSIMRQKSLASSETPLKWLSGKQIPLRMREARTPLESEWLLQWGISHSSASTKYWPHQTSIRSKIFMFTGCNIGTEKLWTTDGKQSPNANDFHGDKSTPHCKRKILSPPDFYLVKALWILNFGGNIGTACVRTYRSIWGARWDLELKGKTPPSITKVTTPASAGVLLRRSLGVIKAISNNGLPPALDYVRKSRPATQGTLLRTF